MALLAALVVAVFTLKLVVLWQLKDHILLQPDAGLDTSTYIALARRALAGDFALGPGLYFVSPLYIYFTAIILGVGNSLTAIRLVQIALGSASVGLVWWTAREWAGERTAWIAAAVAALTGLFTFYESLLLQAAVDPFLTALALALFARALTRTQLPWFCAAGAAFGLQSLNRPNVLLATVGLVLILALTSRWRGAAAMLVGVGVAVAPVSVRNAAVAGEWMPVSSQGGLNFYIGNHANADGTYSRVPGITPSIVGQQDDARHVAEQATGRSLQDTEVSSYFFRLGFEWIRSQPAAAARLFVRKIGYVFHASHLSLNYSYAFYAYDAGTLLAALVIGPSVLVPLGIAGLGWFAWTRRSPAFASWCAFVPLYAIAVAIFFVSERYRLPLLVPLCIGTAVTVDAALTAISARNIRSIAGLLGCAAIIAVAVNWPLHLDDGRAEERTRMAERLALSGRVEEAEHWAVRAEEIHPMPGVMHFRIGRAFLAQGNADAALSHLTKAARINPDRGETSFALGQALMDAGRPADAIPYLRRALNAGVRKDVAGYDLVRALAATGDRTGALGILHEVEPARADDAKSWYRLGELAQELDDPSLATAFYERAIQADPQSGDSRERLGLMLAMSGDFHRAVSELEAAVRLAPSNPTAHLNLAVTYFQLGRRHEARTQAETALRLNPKYEKAAELLKALNKGAGR